MTVIAKTKIEFTNDEGSKFAGFGEIGFNELGDFIVLLCKNSLGVEQRSWDCGTSITISSIASRKQYGSKVCVKDFGEKIIIAADGGHEHTIKAEREVLDVLLRECEKNKIPLILTGTGDEVAIKIPRSRNHKPERLKIKSDAYCAFSGEKTHIIAAKNSKEFESGTGYLVSMEDEDRWVDSTWFWSVARVSELVLVSVKPIKDSLFPLVEPPSDRNLKPEALVIGDDAYCTLAKEPVRILDSLVSSSFGSGVGYLVVIESEPKWVDASHFWGIAYVRDLIAQSTEPPLSLLGEVSIANSKSLQVGNDVYCPRLEKPVRILDSLASLDFGSGVGYLVVTGRDPGWIDSSHFIAPNNEPDSVEADSQSMSCG